ncbi:MAG: SdpI family protein [Bacteroidetes bacterium]|nr:SdpI family protein [Bacteroidota bacterium]
MKKFNALDAAAVIVWLLPVAYLLYLYPALPASVPLHFGMNGNPDRYGNKSELITTISVLMAVSVLIYLLLKFLPAIDPKKYVRYGEATFQKIALAMVIFLAAIMIGILYATANSHFKFGRLILPVVGLFFAFMGNVMHSIKPNYFAGVRTPWTLEDNDTWRATHRLAGKLWFFGGLMLTAGVLLLPPKEGTIIFMSILAILVLVPVVYSYVYYKNHHPNKTAE